MIRIQGRLVDDEMVDSDGSFDSRWTDSARSMLESVELYMAEHPDLNGPGKIPAKGQQVQVPMFKIQA